MTPLPTPRWDIQWARQLTQWLNANLGTAQASSVDRPGAVFLVPSVLPAVGEIPCDGGVYLRSDFPMLYRALGNAFATGGEGSTMFRVPNLPSPAGLQYRIKTGA